MPPYRLTRFVTCIGPPSLGLRRESRLAQARNLTILRSRAGPWRAPWKGAFLECFILPPCCDRGDHNGTALVFLLWNRGVAGTHLACGRSRRPADDAFCCWPYARSACSGRGEAPSVSAATGECGCGLRRRSYWSGLLVLACSSRSSLCFFSMRSQRAALRLTKSFS